jgi:hypothetical protein
MGLERLGSEEANYEIIANRRNEDDDPPRSLLTLLGSSLVLVGITMHGVYEMLTLYNLFSWTLKPSCNNSLLFVYSSQAQTKKLPLWVCILLITPLGDIRYL